METNCPNCSNRLVVDDTKVPDTPFILKCPQCQGTIKLPGKAVAAASASRPTSLPPPPPTPASATTPPPGSAPPPPATGSMGPALVSLTSSELGNGVSALLTRLGFGVEPLDDDTVDDKIQRVRQGEYPMLAVSRSGVPKDRDLYAVVRSLSPRSSPPRLLAHGRRRVQNGRRHSSFRCPGGFGGSGKGRSRLRSSPDADARRKTPPLSNVLGCRGAEKGR